MHGRMGLLSRQKTRFVEQATRGARASLEFGRDYPDLDAARLEADGEEVLVAGHALELDGPRHALERQLEQQSLVWVRVRVRVGLGLGLGLG